MNITVLRAWSTWICEELFSLGRKISWPLELCHLQLADFGCFLPCGPSFWMSEGASADVLWSIVSIGFVCGIQMHLCEFSCDKSCSSSGRDSAPKWSAFCAVVEWCLCDREKFVSHANTAKTGKTVFKRWARFEIAKKRMGFSSIFTHIIQVFTFISIHLP